MNISLKIISLSALIGLFATNMHAQKLSKEEKAIEKEYATKLKELAPLQFKELVEKHQQLQQKVKAIDAQIQEVRLGITAKDDEITILKAANEKLEQEKIAHEATIIEKPAPKNNASGNGAFSAVVGTGADKQILAQFESRQQAEEFKANLQKIGMTGVSIVAGKNK